MNIWDSVQRGLEKATQEATRIAKVQRLRAILDGLSKQIDMQRGQLISKSMELFAAGQLTQSELLSICQELSHLQQQFAQTQNELKITQSQGGQGTSPNTTTYPPQTSMPAHTSNADSQPPSTVYAPPPPDYQHYDSTASSLAPPPSGIEHLTVSSLETVIMGTPPSIVEQNRCRVCQSALVPGNAFCQHCGAPTNADASHQPTVRGSLGELSGEKDESKADPQPAIENQAMIRTDAADLPLSANTPQHQDDGGQ